MKIQYFIFAILTSFIFITCKKDDVSETKGIVEFNFVSKSSNLKSATYEPHLSFLSVSIENLDGVSQYKSDTIELLDFGDGYISAPIKMKAGDYKLTEFEVLDSAYNVVYAAPVAGSQKAYLVNQPLSINFSIQKNQTTNLTPEVINVDSALPADFGYPDFSFNIKNSFFLTVYIYDTDKKDIEITSSNLTITDGTNILYTKSLNAVTSQIPVKDGVTNYILKIQKANYFTYTDTFTQTELISAFNSPITVILQPKWVSDVDGNNYNITIIGSQTWMAENLKTTKYSDGTDISYLPDSASWYADTTGAYCWYENDLATNKAIYGAIYNWYAVSPITNGSRNVCPTGWHVPGDDEWAILVNYLGGESVAGGKLKEIGTTHWASPNTGADNNSGFTALPGGYRNGIGWYAGIRDRGIFWTNSINPVTHFGRFRNLSYNNSLVTSNESGKEGGFSVRCLKN